jgi:Sulfotransferase family
MTMALLASSPQVALEREHPYEHRYLAWLTEWAAVADRTQWDFERWRPQTLTRRVLDTDGGDGLVGPPPWPSRQLWAPEDGGDGMATRLLLAAWREFSAQAIERTRRDVGTPRTRVLYHAEKTVSAARLRELSPLPIRALVVHRDPRDVWLSVQAFNRARGYHAFGRDPGQGEEEWLERFLAAQRERLRATLAERRRTDSLLLAYDDLVSRPERVAAQVGSWLGVELDPAAPARHLERHGDHATSASPEASLARWRSELDPERRERFRAELGSELRELGYSD